MKRRWIVQREAVEERVEADEVEIMASGVLVFYRFQSRRENERTLLLALSPASWRRCQLESDALAEGATAVPLADDGATHQVRVVLG